MVTFNLTGRMRKLCSKIQVDVAGTEDHVIVVGAGIAGLATALALHKVQIPVLVLEADPELRLGGSAVNLWSNAFRALQALGVAQPLLDSHPALARVELCTAGGATLRSFSFDECDGGPHATRGMRRATLLRALADAMPQDSIRFGAAVADVAEHAQGATIRLQSGEEVRCRAVVGADGVGSRVAAALKVPLPNLAGYSAYRGVATFSGGLPLPLDTIRQVWGNGVRAGMYPISDTELYWFTCFNSDTASDAAGGRGGGSASPAEMKADAFAPVEGWALGVAEAIANTTATDITRSRLGDRWTAPGATWGRGCLTLAGDAAHPMTPNLGQGGCCALEDGVVLARTLRDAFRASGAGTSGTADVAAALREYERQRSRRVFPVTVRSAAFGLLLQIPYAPVCAVRNIFVEKALSPAHFLDHTQFDCGRLD